MAPTLRALHVGGDPARWREAGFAVDASGRCRIGAVDVLVEGPGTDGVRAWVLDGAAVPEAGGLDGLPGADPTPDGHPGATDPGEPAAAHPNGALHIDHLVVSTPDLGRTVGAFEAAGLALRRTRDTGRGAQAFFWIGEPILELVGPAAPRGDGPARFWGIAVTVEDLDAAAVLLGERLGAVKDAVQPGRRIATIRREVGLTVPVALMSPHQGGPGAVDPPGRDPGQPGR